MTTDAVRPPAAAGRAALMSAASLACAVLLGFSAFVRIPIPGTPVPVTLQTFALLGFGGLLGRSFSLQMVAWYLTLGLVGAPFFAGGNSGWNHFIGPTGGYLLGFFFAAAIVGFVGEATRSFWKRCFIYLAATSAIFLPGLAWLKITTGGSWHATLAMGLFPFIAGDLVKAVAAGGGVTAACRWMR